MARGSLVPKARLCKASLCLACAVGLLVRIEAHPQAGSDILGELCVGPVSPPKPWHGSVLSGRILGAQRSDNGSYVCKLSISGREVVSDPILVQLEGEYQGGQAGGVEHCAPTE